MTSLPLRRWRRIPRGQALVEMALLLPILLLLVAGAVDLGRVWYSEITITNAAREGAMEAAVAPTSYDAGQPCDKDSNRVMCRTMNEATGSWVTVTPADVSMSCDPSCTPGTPAAPHTVTVQVQGHFDLLTPLMAIFTGGSNITLTSSASATIAMSPNLATPSTQTPSPSPTPSPTASPSPTPSGSASGSPTASPSPTPTPTVAACVAPTANFSVSPTSGKKNKTTFVFTDFSTNMTNPACNNIWSWSFGDGSGASSAEHPSYVYNKKGNYTATLVVSNDAGNSSDSVTINVTN